MGTSSQLYSYRKPIFHLKGPVYVEVTSFCNLRCMYCYNRSGENATHMNLDLFHRITQNTKATGGTTIILSGGEPLMHPDISKIFDIVNNEGLKLMLITNGTLLSDKVIEEIKFYDIHVQVSIDGASSDVHDRIRGDGTFYELLERIKMLKKNNVNMVKLKCVIHRHNYQHITDIENFARDMDLEIEFGWLLRKGRAVENFEVLAPDLLNIYKRGNYRPSLHTNCPLFSLDSHIPIAPKIDVLGNVFMCQVFSDNEFSIGNIERTDFVDILTGDRVSRLYEFYQFRKYYMKDCYDCTWKGVCTRGCPGLGYFQTDYLCELRKHDFIEQMSSKGNIV